MVRGRSASSDRLTRFAVPAVAAVLFALTYLTAVLTTRGQRLENDALSAASVPHGEPLLLAFVSIPDLFLALIIVVVIGLVRRRKDAALRAFLVLALSNLATQLFKYKLLDRPNLSDLLTDNTFPSGHTTAYLSVTIAFLIVMPPRLRPIVAVFGALASSAAAVDLMNYGWHRLSDIVGAVLLVVTIASLVVTLVRPVASALPAEKQSRLGSLTLIGGGTVALVLGVAFALASRFAADSSDRLLLTGTECFAVSAICVAFLAMRWVLGRSKPALGVAEFSAEARRRTPST